LSAAVREGSFATVAELVRTIEGYLAELPVAASCSKSIAPAPPKPRVPSAEDDSTRGTRAESA